jgi:hypothetical protein
LGVRGWSDYTRERDPNHHFTILELVFKNLEDIPFYNHMKFQKYPLCKGSLNVSNIQKPLIFPLWEYKELVHGYIRWEYREYIKWAAIRSDRTTYIIYTNPVMWMDDIDDYIDLLTAYLEIDSEQELMDFVTGLRQHKANSRIAWEAVELLQKMLIECGFDPGSIDGRYGILTEKALAELLIKLGYLSVYQTENVSGEIYKSLKVFQNQSGLSLTGRCDKETIEMLKKEYLKITDRN